MNTVFDLKNKKKLRSRWSCNNGPNHNGYSRNLYNIIIFLRDDVKGHNFHSYTMSTVDNGNGFFTDRQFFGIHCP